MATVSAVACPIAFGAPAGATSISTLQQRARAIATKVDVTRARLDVLAEQYDQAAGRSTVLKAKIAAGKKALRAAADSVHADNSNLRHQAVDAYVNAGAATSLSAEMSSSANSLPLQQTYLAVAGASLDTAVSSLQDSEHQLTVRQATLTAEEAAAATTASELQGAQATAQGLESTLNSTLASVNGALSVAVNQQEAAEAAQRAAAAAAATQAVPAAQQQAAGVADQPTASASNGPAPSGAPGQSALQAAVSQLGTPYRWAGAAPGGFDCSGLAMWSWSHAGVNLPHSAAAQYESIEHISMTALQPGDLIFYASGGYINHVVMYAGGGRVIQAENSGIPVLYTPVWPNAVGAGRP